MLTSLRQMMGASVVLNARRVGYVERVIHDPGARLLAGVVVRRGIGVAKWSPAYAVRVVGHGRVLIDQPPERMPDVNDAPLTSVFLTTGDWAGEVTDVLLQGETLRVLALEVSSGPLYRLWGQRTYAAEYCVRTAGDEAGRVVVPELLSWAQLQRIIEGRDRG